MAQHIARIAVLAAGLVVIVAIVFTSFDRDLYFAYRDEDRASWEYPTGGVVLVVIATAFETALAYAVLVTHSPRRTWIRALLGLALLAPVGLVVSEAIVEAPMFWWLHAAWVGLLSSGLALAALVFGTAEAFSSLRGKRGTGAERGVERGQQG